LLINVTNVMPIPEERLVLLSLCREKIKEKGIAFWYNWRDPTEFKARMRINDGFFKGVDRQAKTFHGEWDRAWVYNAMNSSGFSRDEDIILPNVGNNQAYVFRANRPILLTSFLDLDAIKRGGKNRNADDRIAETGPINFLDTFMNELQAIETGKAEQAKFHHLSERLISNIFDHQLRDPDIEREINEARGFIDILYHNRNQPGFFKDLSDLRKVLCATVSVECKNYADDVGNPEYDQLAGRLNDDRGNFGLLVCRSISNRELAIGHCRDRLKDKKYIIVLDDHDMLTLARHKQQSDHDVDRFMERKLAEVVN